MPDPTQGATLTPSADPGQGGSQVVSADATGQGGNGEASNAQQGAAPPQSQPDLEAQLRGLQARLDQDRAERFALEQKYQTLNAQIAQQHTQTVQTNPFDPNTQPQQWWEWTMEAQARRVATETRKQVQEELGTALQRAQETQWVQQNQQRMAQAGVSYEQVKQFQNLRGIQNPDDALTLLTLPSAINQVQTQAINNTFNQLRQPQQGAQPLRGGQSPGLTAIPQARYEDDAKAYIESNGRVAQSWTAERKAAFDAETTRRDFAQRTGK